MNYLLAVLVFGTCVFLMAVGLIFAKKTLKKGCSLDPDECRCKKEGRDPSECDK